MFISLTIPTRNRADLLHAALDSITRQTLDLSEFELIIVDNGSTDHTAQVVNDYAAKLPNLVYIYDPVPGLHTGRHAGMKAAKGDILVFADDDIEAFPSWLSSIKEGFGEPDVAMVGGNNIPMYLCSPPQWLIRMWNRPSLYGGKALPSLSILELPDGIRPINPDFVWGCNFSIRKSVLLAAGGFHPDGMPKEMICLRGDGETHVSRYVEESGMKCLFHSGASVYHKVTAERMTFSYFRQRGFNQGVSDSYTDLRNQTRKQQTGKKNLLHRIARRIFRLGRDFMEGRDVMRAMNELKLGQQEGYAYHQNAYQIDPEVRVWVHKDKYFEDTNA